MGPPSGLSTASVPSSADRVGARQPDVEVVAPEGRAGERRACVGYQVQPLAAGIQDGRGSIGSAGRDLPVSARNRGDRQLAARHAQIGVRRAPERAPLRFDDLRRADPAGRRDARCGDGDAAQKQAGDHCCDHRAGHRQPGPTKEQLGPDRHQEQRPQAQRLPDEPPVQDPRLGQEHHAACAQEEDPPAQHASIDHSLTSALAGHVGPDLLCGSSSRGHPRRQPGSGRLWGGASPPVVVGTANGRATIGQTRGAPGPAIGFVPTSAGVPTDHRGSRSPPPILRRAAPGGPNSSPLTRSNLARLSLVTRNALTLRAAAAR